jgi:sialic acid synthase SpsE
MIEKHFTLARADGGPDAEFSMEPHEFKDMAQAIRVAEKALGRVSYEFTEHEAASRVYRRSLFVVKDVKAGETFTTKNVRSIRPGHGLAPKYTDEVIGRHASCDIMAGTPVSRDLLG